MRLKIRCLKEKKSK